MATRASDTDKAKAAALPPGNREEQLLAIACSLFANRGYQATSLRDIAEAANITKAALYHYFPNKDELYERVVIQSLDALVHMVGAEVARADTPTARVRAFMRASADFLDTQRDQWLAGAHAFREAGEIQRRGVALHLRDTYEKLLRRCVEDGIATGEFTGMDAAMATRFLLSSLNYVTRWHSPQGRLSVREVMAQFVDMALLGLTTREGRPVLALPAEPEAEPVRKAASRRAPAPAPAPRVAARAAPRNRKAAAATS